MARIFIAERSGLSGLRFSNPILFSNPMRQADLDAKVVWDGIFLPLGTRRCRRHPSGFPNVRTLMSGSIWTSLSASTSGRVSCWSCSVDDTGSRGGGRPRRTDSEALPGLVASRHPCWEALMEPKRRVKIVLQSGIGSGDQGYHRVRYRSFVG